MALLLTVLAISGALTANAQMTPTTIKLKVLQGRPVVDGVFINGNGPYRFLLDTGSQANQMEAGLAKKIGLVPTLQVDLYTAAGNSIVHGGRASKVALGTVEAAGQEFLFTSCDGLHMLSPDIRGILGQEFLAHFDYTLDFQHHQLLFGQPPIEGAHIAVHLLYGRMTVSTNQGELVLDSGADTLFLFRESPHSSTVHLSTSSGMSTAVAFERAPELRIGDRLYHPELATFHTVPAATEAGLLPASMFHALFISNSEKYVVIDPDVRR
jgi:hypothetical protein